MSPTAKLMTGRVILTVVAVGTIGLPFMADWNESHIYNPLWPPHAKFHNAQTMAMAVLLGLSGLFFIWRRDGGGPRVNLLPALLTTGFYWLSQALAFTFPGVAWTDPNLLQSGHTLTDFPPQLKGDLGFFVLLAFGGWLIADATRDRVPRKATTD